MVKIVSSNLFSDLGYKDYRLPENRLEGFIRHFEWRRTTKDLDHTHYCQHVTKDYDVEQKIWFSLLFGLSYRVPQAHAYMHYFPSFHDYTKDDFENWNSENWSKTLYSIDSRYNKGFFGKQASSIKDWLNGSTFEEKLFPLIVDGDEDKSFDNLYSSIRNIYKFGRMSTWLTLQCIYDILEWKISPSHVLLTSGGNTSCYNGAVFMGNKENSILAGKKNPVKPGYKPTLEERLWADGVSKVYWNKIIESLPEFNVDAYSYETLLCQHKKMFLTSNEYFGHACFVGETEIILHDNSIIKLEDLVGKTSFNVYSKSSNKETVIGKGYNAHFTKHVTELCELHLTNGDIIKSTPDHRFMLLDGSYKEIQHIQNTDYLMPIDDNVRGIKGISLYDCEPTPVYDITVEKYNNFSLSSGIIVHNSGDCSETYPKYKNNFPEVDWLPLCEALMSQPEPIRGRSLDKGFDKIGTKYGVYINGDSIYDDMPDVYSILDLPKAIPVKELFIDIGEPIPEDHLYTHSGKEVSKRIKNWKFNN